MERLWDRPLARRALDLPAESTSLSRTFLSVMGGVKDCQV
jgi:hypothetical protein